MKILVVEDTEDLRILLEDQLQFHGNDVDSAANGVEALEKAHSSPPDLIISDILMPEMDGFALCREVKKDEQLRKIPLIFYTSTYLKQKDKELAMSLGVSRYIFKPIDIKHFLQIIDEVMKECREGYLPTPEQSLKSNNDLDVMHTDSLTRKLGDKLKELEWEREALKQSEARLHDAQTIAHLGNWQWNIVKNTVNWSDELYKILGLTPKEFPANYEGYVDCIHPDDRAVFQQSTRQILEEKQPYSMEYRIIRPNGDERIVREKGALQLDEKGNPISLVGTVQDITEQKRTEIALAVSEEKFRNLVESSQDWVWEVDARGVYTYASPRCHDLLGYEPKEIIGRKPFDLMPEDEAKRILRIFQRIVAKATPIIALENINLHKDGHQVVLETSGVPFFDDRGALAGYRGMDRDITDRRQVEKERLAYIERQRDALVAEVHHRIKNHLQGLMGLLKQRKKFGREYADVLDEAITQIESIAIVYGLQSRNSGGGIYFNQMFDAIVHSVTGLSQIPLTVVSDRAGCACEVDRDKAVPLALVINELLMNSVKHFRSESEGQEIKITNRCVPEGIVLEISNPGSLPDGFDFEKERGLGTGLELAKVMLPSKGAQLSISDQDNEVMAELVLSPPLLKGVGNTLTEK